jgi:hypothetical protein
MTQIDIIFSGARATTKAMQLDDRGNESIELRKNLKKEIRLWTATSKIWLNRSSGDVARKSSWWGFLHGNIESSQSWQKTWEVFARPLFRSLKIRGQLSNVYSLLKIHLEMLRHLWAPFTGSIGCLQGITELGSLPPIWTSKGCCHSGLYRCCWSNYRYKSPKYIPGDRAEVGYWSASNKSNSAK